MAHHLETCPASVVYCTMEWNRWPVYSKERKARVPFVQNNIPQAEYGQLDVALALRDQEALNDAMKAPQKTRHVLRSSLKQHFPAVPLTIPKSVDTEASAAVASVGFGQSSIEEEEDVDAPWNMPPPGLQKSMCGRLFNAKGKAAATTVDCPENQDGHQALPGYTTHGTKAGSYSLDGNELEDFKTCDPFADLTVTDLRRRELTKRDYSVLVCDKQDTEQVHAEQQISHPRDENLKPSEPASEMRSLPNQMALDCDDANSCDTATTSDNPEEATSQPSLTLQQLLALDLNVESITRYQSKPKSMYTFLCAQAFRRDEYPWHFRNVHSEIHSGLNGWLEQRCPLACYGCTYSVRRLHPNTKGSRVIWSSVVKGFSVQPYVPKEHLSVKGSSVYGSSLFGSEVVPEILTSRDYNSEVKVNGNQKSTSPVRAAEEADEDDTCALTLTDLPFELLQHIAQFLCGFSLNNLALTCRVLREVCRSLLEEKGIVSLEWERQERGGSHTWQVTHKVSISAC